MVIREAGVLFRGFTLTNASYHKVAGEKIDPDLRSSLLTALLNFAESAFSTDAVEYFQMNKFVIAFIKDEIIPSDSPEPEIILCYVILDKQRWIDRHIKKVIRPSIERVLIEFKKKYNKKNLSEITQFKDFKGYLDQIFGSDTKTVDQKLHGTFFD